MTPAYRQGVQAALAKLGFSNLPDTHGNPYPGKAKSIQAERLADILQADETEATHQSADNATQSKWNRPVTWSSPVNLAGLDEGQPVAGIIVPSSPRS